MIKAVLFDLDNTLIDFLTFKKETAKAAAAAMVRQGLPVDEIRAYGLIFGVYDEKGIEHQKTFYEVIKPFNLPLDDAERIQQAAIIAYLQLKFEVLRAYPDVKLTLRKLRAKGLRLGVVTDAPRNKAWQRLVLTGLEREFELVVAHDDTIEMKPHPSPFSLALKRLGVLAGGCLFVGDNPERDIKGAKAVGMRTCWARYGSMLKEGGADYEIRKFGEILKVVER